MLSKSGNHKNVLRLVPPLCLAMEEMEHVFQALDRSFQDLKGKGCLKPVARLAVTSQELKWQ
ncbi:MAG: hypothetical protein P8M25_15525 [Paracoccaceae bacterium]|nr:hypothetical protein [Paracoccaceae bacterium]